MYADQFHAVTQFRSGSGVESEGAVRVWKKLVLFFIIFSAFFSSHAQWMNTGYGIYDGQVDAVLSTGGILIAGSRFGGAFRSTDNGDHWEPINNGLSEHRIKTLVAFGGKIFAGTFGGIYVTADNGDNWSLLTSPSLFVPSFAIRGTTIFAGTSQGVYRSTDNGSTWAAANTGLTSPDQIMAMCTDGTRIYAAREGGTFHVSDNDGALWTTVGTGLPQSLSFVIRGLAFNGNAIYASYPTGLYKSTDNGVNFSLINASISPRPFLFKGSEIFVGTQSGVLKSSDGGVNWTNVSAGIPFSGFPFASVNDLATDGTNIFAGTHHRGVFITSNDGTSWTPKNNGLINPTPTVLKLLDTKMLVASKDKVFRSTNDGVSWTPSTTTLITTGINDLEVLGGSAFVCTSEGGVFVSTDGGDVWSASNTGLTTTHVLRLAASGINILAATISGVFISSDGGANWSPTSLGSATFIAIASKGNKVYASNNLGIIFYSSNNGVNWTTMGTLSGTVNCFGFTDDHLFAGTQTGLYRSANNGLLWDHIGVAEISNGVKAFTSQGNKLFIATNSGKALVYPGDSFVDLRLDLASGTSKSITSFKLKGNVLYSCVTPGSGDSRGSVIKYNVPDLLTITSISPTFGPVGSTVTINGTRFWPSIAQNEVRFGSTPATILTATTTMLTVEVPATFGIHSIEVFAGTEVLSESTFTITPAIIGFDPGEGHVGSTVTVTGSGFNPHVVTSLKFNGVSSVDTQHGASVTNTSITAPVPIGATTGLISIIADGLLTATSTEEFEVLPYIESFTPTEGTTGIEVQITGTGFASLPGDNVVKFNGEIATVTEVVDGTITAIVPEEATTGPITVTVGGNVGESDVDFIVSEELTVVTGDIQATGINRSTIFPNPASDFVTVNLEEFPESEVVTIHVFDAIGKNFAAVPCTGGKNIRIDVFHYPPGTFLVKIAGSRKNVYGRFMKR